VCALVHLPVAAQTRGAIPEFGIKGGIPFSTIRVDLAEDVDSRTALGGGAFVHVPLGPVGIQLEVLYMQKGAVLGGNDADLVGMVIALDYIEVPLLVTVPIDVGPSVTPYLFSGPALAFEVGCAFERDAEGVEASIDCTGSPAIDFELTSKKLDIGLTLGGGLRVPLGPGALLLEGRYTFGLVNINDDPVENGDNFKNRSAAGMIGFSFPLKR
jgi:hypothetical protein